MPIFDSLRTPAEDVGKLEQKALNTAVSFAEYFELFNLFTRELQINPFQKTSCL